MNKQKVKWLVLLVTTVAIITFAFIRISQIHVNHQANLIKSEECMLNGGTVIIEESLLSLSTVHCE